MLKESLFVLISLGIVASLLRLIVRQKGRLSILRSVQLGLMILIIIIVLLLLLKR